MSELAELSSIEQNTSGRYSILGPLEMHCTGCSAVYKGFIGIKTGEQKRKKAGWSTVKHEIFSWRSDKALANPTGFSGYKWIDKVASIWLKSVGMSFLRKSTFGY